MSLTAAVAAKRNAKRRELKTLVFDIERLPGQALVERHGLTITGNFWDMNSWKRTIGRRIMPDEVTLWPSTLCFAASWLGSKDKIFKSAWDDRADMVKSIRDLLDEADIVVGYNSRSFDEKHVASDIVMAELPPPSPYRSIDLYSIVRQRFGFESKKLGTVLDRLQMPTKTDVYDPDIAQRALDGDVKAQNRLKRYNLGDTDVTAALYWRLLPWIKAHPHVAPVQASTKSMCPRCASTNLKRAGTWTPGVYVYAAYECRDCQGYFRTTYEHRGPSVKTL